MELHNRESTILKNGKRKEGEKEKKKERKKWSGRKGQCAELNRQANEK